MTLIPNAKPAAPAYIRRNIPSYDIMGEENLLKIEAAADRILAEVGLDIRDDDECLALFRKAGVKADGMRLRFEPGHLREILKSAPKEFTQHARNPARSVQMGGSNVVFAPAYGSPFVMDLDQGRRYGTLEDFQNFQARQGGLQTRVLEFFNVHVPSLPHRATGRTGRPAGQGLPLQ